MKTDIQRHLWQLYSDEWLHWGIFVHEEAIILQWKGKKKKSMYHHELEHDVSNILLSRKSQTLKGTVILHTLRK